jgi:hypothetical protein
MSKPKPQQLPFQNNQTQNTTNTFGFQSFDPENQFVKDYMNQDVTIDPGARQRTDLAEQSSQNKWNSAFALGIPQSQRMMMQGAEQRDIQQQGSYAQQQAEYQKRALELARKQSLLPQLVQTGGSMTGQSSGYNTQMPQSGGLLNTIVGSGISGGLATAAVL